MNCKTYGLCHYKKPPNLQKTNKTCNNPLFTFNISWLFFNEKGRLILKRPFIVNLVILKIFNSIIWYRAKFRKQQLHRE